MPHRISQKTAERTLLYRFSDRAEPRAVHDAAIRRHAEQVQGAVKVQRFRRCVVCLRLHSVAVVTCDGQGKFLYELWAAFGDLVFVED